MKDSNTPAKAGKKKAPSEKNMDVNNAGIKIFQKKSALQIFMRKETHSTRMLDLKFAHNAF